LAISKLLKANSLKQTPAESVFFNYLTGYEQLLIKVHYLCGAFRNELSLSFLAVPLLAGVVLGK
jgi:hypothetical protein